MGRPRDSAERSAPGESAVEADGFAGRRLERLRPRAVLHHARPATVRTQRGRLQPTAPPTRRPPRTPARAQALHASLGQAAGSAGSRSTTGVRPSGRGGATAAASPRCRRSRRSCRRSGTAGGRRTGWRRPRPRPRNSCPSCRRAGAGSRAGGGAVAVAQARPQVHLPGHRPAGAVVAAQLQRAPHRRRRARASRGRDLRPG